MPLGNWPRWRRSVGYRRTCSGRESQRFEQTDPGASPRGATTLASPRLCRRDAEKDAFRPIGKVSMITVHPGVLEDRLVETRRGAGALQQEVAMLPRRTKQVFYVIAGPLMRANGMIYRSMLAPRPGSGVVRVQLGPARKITCPAGSMWTRTSSRGSATSGATCGTRSRSATRPSTPSTRTTSSSICPT